MNQQDYISELHREMEIIATGAELDSTDKYRWVIRTNGILVEYFPRTNACIAFNLRFKIPFDNLIKAIEKNRLRPKDGDARFRPGHCVPCGQEIIYYVEAPGSKIDDIRTLNADGTLHYSTCQKMRDGMSA